MSMRAVVVVVPVLLMLGCRDRQDPSPARVVIEAEHVEQICRGTTTHAESELARMEAEFELGPASEPIEVVVVDPEQIAEHCPDGEAICVQQPPRRVFISAAVFDAVLTRELVRGRISEVSTKPFLVEGLLTALTRPMCAPLESWDPPSAETILALGPETSLDTQQRYLAGTLLRWLLDTQGPKVVLDFMSTLDRHASANEVRVAYLERFGGSIDAELSNHWPSADVPLAPERAGCIGEELPHDPLTSSVRLSAEFDCGSPKVRNDFEDPSRAFVEWILTIDESTKGTYRLAGDWPEDVSLTVERCECRPAIWTEQPAGAGDFDDSFHPEYGARLEPGTYRLRAHAPIGTTLDTRLIAPCDYEAQNCPAGQQCRPSGWCEDEVPKPGQAGHACSPTAFDVDSPLACDVGLMCVGAAGEPGVCMTYCGEDVDATCPDDLTCAYLSVCARACDPLAQDCDPGESCSPDFETGTGACLPTGGLGPLETCSEIDLACGPGLVCKNHESVPGCWSGDPDAWLDFTGCCTPICDPSAPDPGCPAELPNCVAEARQALGLCQP